MLLEGPPAISMSPVPLTLPPPFMDSEPEIVGFNTRMGMGEVASRTAQIEDAPVLCLDIPLSIPANQVGMFSVIWTRTSAAGATLEGGKFRPPRPTLAAEGKSMNTLSPIAPEP